MKKVHTTLCLLATLIVSAAGVACSDHDADTDAPAYAGGEVRCALPVEPWLAGRAATRATRASSPSSADFEEAYPVDNVTLPAKVGVWGYKTADVNDDASTPWIDNATFAYEAADGLYHRGTWNMTDDDASEDAYKWSTTADVTSWEGTDYEFFAYAPPLTSAATVTDAASSTTTDADAAVTTAPAVSFDKKARTFTLTGLTDFATSDYLVASRLKAHNPTKDGDVVKFTDEKHLFKHLMACLRIGFSLNADYAAVRYLNLKEVTLTLRKETTPLSYTYTATFPQATAELTAEVEEKWTPSTTATDNPTLTLTPTQGGTWYLGGSDRPGGKYHLYGQCYVVPQAYVPLTLRVTYDVYDPADNVTRRDAVSTGTITLTTENTTSELFAAGCYYNLLVQIEPDYLYVLSNDDEETWKLE